MSDVQEDLIYVREKAAAMQDEITAFHRVLVYILDTHHPEGVDVPMEALTKSTGLVIECIEYEDKLDIFTFKATQKEQ